jgi:Sodium:solute symporter family
MRDLLPNGVLGLAVTGLLASFMAGMAANVSGFNTVFTYDIWQPYLRKDRPDGYYLKVGRVITVIGVAIGIGTAFIAAGYNNIMNYLQALFSLFNAPLSGMLASATVYFLYLGHVLHFGSDLDESFWGAGIGFVVVGIVSVLVTMVTTAKPEVPQPDPARLGGAAAGRGPVHPVLVISFWCGGAMADDDGEVRSAARLFDVRNVIGGLFTVYGVIITIVGLVDKRGQIDKAQGCGSTCGWGWRCSRSGCCSCCGGRCHRRRPPTGPATSRPARRRVAPRRDDLGVPSPARLPARTPREPAR